MNDIMGNKQIASLQDVISPLISKTIDSGARSIFRLIKPLVVPSITVRENDWQYYNDIHRTLYKLNPKEYNRHRIPTKNKNLYDLTIGTRYIHKIDDRNYLVIIEDIDVQTNPALKYLTINFYGLDRHKNRDTFLKKMRRFDKSTITLRYLGRNSLTCEVSPREFDSIILKKRDKRQYNTWSYILEK